MARKRKPGVIGGSGEMNSPLTSTGGPMKSTGLNRIEKMKEASNKFLTNSQQSMESEFSQISGYSDGDQTPIPSLHGNLVRTQHKRDPLE